MANPQCENGYTKIANELMETLAKTRIPGEARQVLDFIFRQTYGWNKKTDDISLSQFSAGTGLSKPHICQALNTLRKMSIITEYGKGGLPNTVKVDGKISKEIIKTYAIIKDFELWRPLPKKVKVSLPNTVIVTEYGKTSLPNSDTTKEISTKERKNIVHFRFEEIWKKYPERIGRKLAEKHFRVSVKTEEDWKNINLALDNYLKSDRVNRGIIQNGSTWFNNWKDWVDYQPQIEPPKDPKNVLL